MTKREKLFTWCPAFTLYRQIVVASFVLLLNSSVMAQPLLSIETQRGRVTLCFHPDSSDLVRIPVSTLDAGRSVFHWTHREWAQEVDMQKGLTTRNMEYFQQKGLAKGFRQYGGFYVSTDMWDSAWYGQELLILELKQRLFIVPFKAAFQKRILKAFHDDPIQLQNALSALGIGGSFKHRLMGKSSWINIFDVNVTDGVRMATSEDFASKAANESFLFRKTPFSALALTYLRLTKHGLKKNPHLVAQLLKVQ